MSLIITIMKEFTMILEKNYIILEIFFSFSLNFYKDYFFLIIQTYLEND